MDGSITPSCPAQVFLAARIIQKVEQVAAANRLLRIERVVLEIGEWVTVQRDLLDPAFEFASRGTVAEGAVLEIGRPPRLLGGGACDAECLRDRADLRCPACPEEEFRLKSIVGK